MAAMSLCGCSRDVRTRPAPPSGIEPFRKKRSHAPGPTTIIAEPASGAFIEGSKADRREP
jgi:hypothetical protein